MEDNKRHIQELYSRWVDKTASEDETAELFTLLDKVDINETLDTSFKAIWLNEVSDEGVRKERHKAILAAILANYPAEIPAGITPSVYQVHFLKTAWFRYAALLLLVAGTATFLYLNHRPQPAIAIKQLSGQPADVLPGANRAVLTIDNKQIDLDSAKSGITAGSVITYTDGEKLAEAGGTLMLTTPKGGQYQAVLPDGSKVWLNAASSIQFPSKFSGSTRKVIVTGEVYFEIAKDSRMPFSVTAYQTKIDVLGTSFNVNAYENEPTIKTTLMEGSVRVNAYDHSQMLKPGQQSQIKSFDQVRVLDKIDIKQVMAWKNGYFDFNNADLPVAMRQIERWYAIEVTYEGKVPEVIFKGKMDRNVLLSDVVRFLKNFGIKADLQGRHLIISGS